MAIKTHKPQGGCALGCLGLLTPRIVIVLLVVFGDFIGTAFSAAAWPILGFIFMPITTLAAAVGHHYVEGSQAGAIGYWATIGVGIVLDLGFVGGGSWGLRRTRKG